MINQTFLMFLLQIYFFTSLTKPNQTLTRPNSPHTLTSPFSFHNSYILTCNDKRSVKNIFFNFIFFFFCLFIEKWSFLFRPTTINSLCDVIRNKYKKRKKNIYIFLHRRLHKILSGNNVRPTLIYDFMLYELSLLL